MPKPPVAKISARATRRRLQQDRKKLLAERREMIFEMLIAGYRHDHIAKRFGVSVKSLRREVDRVLDERERAAPQRYINLQLARLDKAMRVVSEAIHDDNLDAVPLLFQVQAQYDRYEGLASRLARAPNKIREGQFLSAKVLKSLNSAHETGAAQKALAFAAETAEPRRREVRSGRDA